MASIISAGNATSGVAISSDSTGTLDIKTGTGAATTAISISSAQVVTFNGGVGGLVSGTAQASTSGTTVDFLSIPSWVKRITVMLRDVSLTTTVSTIGVRIGSGSFEATGYLGGSVSVNSSGVAASNGFTTLFPLAALNVATDTINGALVITNVSGNVWVCQGSFFRNSSGVGAGYSIASSKSITAGVLDRVQVMLDSTGAFDGGTINILYE